VSQGQVLPDSPEEFNGLPVDPVTRKPMVWNAKTRMLITADGKHFEYPNSRVCNDVYPQAIQMKEFQASYAINSTSQQLTVKSTLGNPFKAS
jgi:hypothetical protein